jgi:hypothetical protein
MADFCMPEIRRRLVRLGNHRWKREMACALLRMKVLCLGDTSRSILGASLHFPGSLRPSRVS